jgi:hypothetical protein
MSRLAKRAVPVVLAAVAAIAAFAVGIGPQPTDASWTTTKTLAVTATAVLPAAPTGLTCGAGSGLLAAAVPFTWTAPPGTTPSGYTLKWTGITSGSSTWPTTSGSITAPIGTVTVSVYADYGGWQSSAGTQTRSVTGVTFVGWTCT